MNNENNLNPMNPNLAELFADTPTSMPSAPVAFPDPQAMHEATASPEPCLFTESQPLPSPEIVTPPAAPAPQPNNIVDLFGAVVEQGAEEQLSSLLSALANKAPIFDYASIQEEITDASMTFEQLRVKMSADCPELEARSHVSRTLSYAGFSERITDTNSTIFEVKSKLEKSKKFKDAIKKRKPADKEPVCSIKPTITARKRL